MRFEMPGRLVTWSVRNVSLAMRFEKPSRYVNKSVGNVTHCEAGELRR
jgi:hypothetical protein